MSTVVGNDGLEGIPTLEDICSLFRSLINDNFSGGAGQIATDTAPFMKPFLNSAIRDLYSDLRIVGDMKVVKDNYLLNNIPTVPSGNPETQVAVTYTGYFNGTSWNSTLMLPPDLMWVSKVWQRPSGSNGVFLPMRIAPDGLQGGFQGSGMGQYEVRGNNELWMNGSTLATDLRLRYIAVFPDIVNGNIDFTTTFVPIQDCTNAVAHKMVANYAQRLSPDQFSLADARAKEFTKKLVTESILNSQTKEFERIPFGASR